MHTKSFPCNQICQFLCGLYFIIDDVDAMLWTDLSTDTQEFEAESWSLVVDPAFCSKQEKNVIKRQDVIFGQYFRDSHEAENSLAQTLWKDVHVI